MRLARLNCRAKARLLQNQRIHVELDLGQRGGEETKKPSVPKCSEGLRKLLGNSASSLAVFYVEQVALNRHVLSVALTQSESRSPQPQLNCLCLKGWQMSRARFAERFAGPVLRDLISKAN